MKKTSLIIIFLIIFLLTSCQSPGNDFVQDSSFPQNNKQAIFDTEGFSASMADWIQGSNYGVFSGVADTVQKSIIISLSEEAYTALSEQDKEDIKAAISDMLEYYMQPSAAAKEYLIVFNIGGQLISETTEPHASQNTSVQETSETIAGDTVNLVFIHHSCGENWLHDGLSQALNESGYYVADITYGWKEYGDNTDTSDWPNWFNDDVMALVYNEKGTMSASNSIPASDGENEIIMFKSCFPNSDVGSAIDDEKALYQSLLPYFEAHTDKMFILVTPPPMIHISDPVMTRTLCNWLTDRENGWLSALSSNNVFVFDFYNVLTHPDAHHCFINGQEVHEVVSGANTLYYDSSGDDHPNTQGNIKATQEFIGLLNVWYTEFIDRQ